MQTHESPPWPAKVIAAAAVAVVVVVVADHVPLGGLLRPWYLSRSSGLVAFAVLWLSVVLGLLQSCGMLRGLASPVATLGLHDYASVLALYLSLFHALVLVLDHYLRLSPADVLIPFATHYKTGQMALGILGFYLFVIASITTYLRTRISPRLWRGLHLLTLLGFGMALIHGVAMGSDTRAEPVRYMYLIAAVSVGLLTLYRAGLSIIKR